MVIPVNEEKPLTCRTLQFDLAQATLPVKRQFLVFREKDWAIEFFLSHFVIIDYGSQTVCDCQYCALCKFSISRSAFRNGQMWTIESPLLSYGSANELVGRIIDTESKMSSSR